MIQILIISQITLWLHRKSMQCLIVSILVTEKQLGTKGQNLETHNF